jgi:hypothetical protein
MKSDSIPEPEKKPAEEVDSAGCAPTPLLGFLWDFRERAVNHTSYLYGIMTAFSGLYLIEGLFPLTAWPLVKAMACAIAAKRFQSLHALSCDPNDQREGPPTKTSTEANQ